MSRRTRPDMSLHTSSSSSHLESSSASSAISRRVTRSTRSSSVQRTIPTRSAQPTPVKSLPFTNQREGQGRSLPTTSSEDDDEEDDDDDEEEDEVQIEGTPHRLEVTNVRGRTTTYPTPSVTSHTYRSPPKSPTQLRAESDAGVYRIDACNSHEAHITDMFDGRRYAMEEHHHGHSHGSPYRVQSSTQQRQSPQQMKTVHETNSTYTEEIVHDAPPSWNYATIALISLLVLLTGLAVAPYALRTIREPHGYVARPSTDGILRQQDLDHLHKHLKHESERALHSLSTTLTESIHKEEHKRSELQHDITQRMNMAKKEWTHELKRVSDELSTLIRISNAEEAEALQKLRDTVMSKLRDEMTTSLDTTRNRILTELRDEWGTKMSNNNHMLATHQKESMKNEIKKMIEHVDGKIHDVTSHIDTSIKSAITSESQRIHKELKTMEEKWEKNVDDKITSAITADNIQDNKNIQATIQADIPRESDAIAKALKQQNDVQQKYVKDAIQVSEKSMVQRVLDELQKKGGDVDPDLLAKVLAAVDKRVAERTKEPEKVDVSSIRSELLSTLRDEMTSTLSAHTKHTDDAITRVSETSTSQYENLVKQLKKQQEQVQAQASQPASPTSEEIEQHIKQAVTDASPTSEEIEQHIKQAVTDALQKQKKDVIDAATKAATRAAEAVTQNTGTTTPVTIPAEPVDENAIVEAVLTKIAKDLQESRTKTAHVADQIKQVLEHVSHMDTHVNTLSTQSEQQIKTVLSRITTLESRPVSSTSEPATCTSGNCSATANVDITQLQAWVKEELEKQRNATRIELESTRKSTTQEIERALEKYSADRTEMIDFALGTTGGRVITASRTHRVQVTNGLLSYIKDCYLPAHKPDEMLRDSMSVGSCWPMSGSTGYALIYLRDPIIPTHVTLQHISHLIAPEYTTTPKSFRVWGVSDIEADRARQLSIAPRGDLLGTFTYAAKHTQLQTFALQTPPSGATSYRHINFEILSNYGNPNYTCIYRFRVHGTPVGTGTSTPHGIDDGQHQ